MGLDRDLMVVICLVLFCESGIKVKNAHGIA
jgi:hypothetical protein